MIRTSLAGLCVALAGCLTACGPDTHGERRGATVDPGPRPLALIADMEPGLLKSRLQRCAAGPFHRTDFSIGHRGAPLEYPEHTRESYEAAARMGAGIVECDVTFTRDRALVCRHSQCDLHTTTDILTTPLAAKCTEPFRPARFDPISGKRLEAASAKCCTSDLTVTEFKSLRGKLDLADADATTVAQYVAGGAEGGGGRSQRRGTLVTHAESIALFRALGVKMIPELKAPEVPMPFEGSYRQEDYAQQLIDEYINAGISPRDVWLQSFNLQDLRYWIRQAPAFGTQTIYLAYLNPSDGNPDNDRPPTLEQLRALKAAGVSVVAPPLWALLRVDVLGRIVPSQLALDAKTAGLGIMVWSLERSGPLSGGGGWYYQSVAEAIDGDGDMYEVLDVLARDVGVRGVLSDWAGTVTYYANCMGLE